MRCCCLLRMCRLCGTRCHQREITVLKATCLLTRSFVLKAQVALLATKYCFFTHKFQESVWVRLIFFYYYSFFLGSGGEPWRAARVPCGAVCEDRPLLLERLRTCVQVRLVCCCVSYSNMFVIVYVCILCPGRVHVCVWIYIHGCTTCVCVLCVACMYGCMYEYHRSARPFFYLHTRLSL